MYNRRDNQNYGGRQNKQMEFDVAKLSNINTKEFDEIEKSIVHRVDPSKTKQQVCRYYQQGTCRYSDAECQYLHVNLEEKRTVCPHF